MSLAVSPRKLRALDAIVTLWTVAWVLLAVAVAREVHGLRELSSTVVAAGVATEEAGKAVGSLDALPVVGEEVDRIGSRAEEAGRSAQASGRASRESIQDLSVLLGLAIGLVPTLPLLAVYVTTRAGRAREARAVRQALADAGDDPRFLAFLARRAVHNLSLRQLRAISTEPWRDLDEGRYETLAGAELRRLGVERPAPSRSSSRPAA